MPRKGYEFSERVRNQALNDAELESGDVHHKAAIRLCRKKGVCPDLVKAPINSIALTKEDHIRLHKEPDDESFADWLLSLLPRFPGM